MEEIRVEIKHPI